MRLGYLSGMAYGSQKAGVTVPVDNKDLKHAQKLVKKLGARSRAEVLGIAVRYGLSHIEDLLAYREMYLQKEPLPDGATQLTFLEGLRAQIDYQEKHQP